MHRVPVVERLKFRLMALIHEDLYSILRRSEHALKAANLREGLCVLEGQTGTIQRYASLKPGLLGGDF